MRATTRKRRELVEAYLLINAAPRLQELVDFLAENGFEVSQSTASRDLKGARARVAEDPSVPVVFGFAVNLLTSAATECYRGGQYQTMVACLREVKDLLHLDEVIPSAMLKAKTAAAADTSEIRDLFAELVNLTEASPVTERTEANA